MPVCNDPCRHCGEPVRKRYRTSKPVTCARCELARRKKWQADRLKRIHAAKARHEPAPLRRNLADRRREAGCNTAADERVRRESHSRTGLLNAIRRAGERCVELEKRIAFLERENRLFRAELNMRALHNGKPPEPLPPGCYRESRTPSAKPIRLRNLNAPLPA